ncbi:ABC transporter permease subunit [Bacillus salacetis]|uniref:ABC transporter permease subunit n=1 Tax=Bacillus salacetis TaxID=2315464 RepID=UPI003BA3A85F
MIIKRLMKSPQFLTGFIFLFGIFAASIVYYWMTGDQVPKTDLLKGKDGQFLSPPYSPLEFPPLGTDNFGHDVFLLMLAGAKYTIGAALLIAFLRVIPSVVIGLGIHFYMHKFKKIFSSIVEAFNYFPATLLAFLLLQWVMMDGPLMDPDSFEYSFKDKVFIYITILVCISLPSVSLLFSNEIEHIMKKQFIESAKVLGAYKRHYIMYHIRPYLVPQIYMVFLREFISVMILISHLGVLGIFIGGFQFKMDLFNKSQPLSLSHEWSGSLGTWWEFLWTTYPWIAFIPVIFFTLTVLAAKMMLLGLTKAFEQKREVPEELDQLNNEKFSDEEDFEIVSNKAN